MLAVATAAAAQALRPRPTPEGSVMKHPRRGALPTIRGASSGMRCGAWRGLPKFTHLTLTWRASGEIITSQSWKA
eukprot:8620191-Pyramimonas_sp.AAC.1